MAESEKDRIRKRAYAIWEEEGRPWGRDFEHWERANQELAEMPAAAGKKPRGKKQANGTSKPESGEPVTQDKPPAKAPVKRRSTKRAE